ncbi:ORF6N domain-containing protein [Algoriphagus sp. A40]|uniref:ORF6N domain-containing protein n=1 Tax=Algoriphagus sp. A40 TaxID=1945863 RepID=UPI000987755F|nr:ORF6N domain-containing protein [Algoriphagus sp. A40]OOG78636.1 DNA-binding protein [Algoriphagus sp. A40]
MNDLTIENRIYTIRGVQVMLDSDLAELYQVETRTINQAVKRNLERFPEDFSFQLTIKEAYHLRSQNVTLNDKPLSRSQTVILKGEKHSRGKNIKYLPHAFTEQGVAMLSAVLRSEIAVQVSIQIIQAFVSMRKFLLQNASVFHRLDQLEIKQIQTEEKIERIFKAMEAGQPEPDKGIFFDGQIFDAYAFVAGLIKNAKKEIILIDNYVDESVLTLLSKRHKGVKAIIYTKSITKAFQLDLEKHHAQYPEIEVKSLAQSHDRFLILDRTELYHIGASLKDLGKKWFAFSRMDSMVGILIKQLNLDKLQYPSI